MEKLAIFDIDYTITRKESLMEFFKYSVSKDIKNIKFLPRALYSGFLKFIDNIDEKDLATLTKAFYDERLSKLLYKDALDMIKKLKSEGCMVVLISASPEFYIKEFYAIKEVDLIIGTKFTFEGGKFARKMEGNNCKGKEKVERLNQVLKEKNIKVDFKNSYMFSDSLSDKPLLDLVGNPYLINYKKKNEIEILRWK